jgi:4-amino-4-deoxy-L-arabinose transferase-like glycosyltransferase
MVFGYNGLERFGITIKGAVAEMNGKRPASASPDIRQDARRQTLVSNEASASARPAAAASNQAGFGGGRRGGGGWTKLFGSRFGPEIGWLFPLALFALAFGILSRRRAERADAVRGGLIMWGIWLFTFGVTYSAMRRIPHTAYMASLAPPIAALSGAGIVMLWRAYRTGGRAAWALPLVLATELGWTLVLWSHYGGFLPWCRRLILATGAVALLVLVVVRLVSRRSDVGWLASRGHARLAMAGLLAGTIAMVGAPAVWAGSVLDSRYAGTSLDASAGPAGGMELRAARVMAGTERLDPRSGIDRRHGILATMTLSASESRLYHYLRDHRAGARYLMATPSWRTASPYIINTGQEVLAMGGFSGTVPEPTLSTLRYLVRSGQLRFFLLDATTGSTRWAWRGADKTAREASAWVRRSCVRIPAAEYGAGTWLAAATGPAPNGVGRLYQCPKSAG